MYKSVFITCVFILLTLFKGYSNTSQNVQIKGIITNVKEKEIMLYFFNPLIPNIDPIKESVPIRDGAFLYETKILQPTLVSFIINKENLSLYLEPGDQLQLFFDSETLWQTLTYTGKGASNNNYRKDFKNKFYPKNFDFSNFIKDKNAAEFKKYFDDQKQAQLDFLKKREKELSPQFRKLAIGGIESFYAANILKYPGFYYPGLWKTFNGLPSELPKNFYEGIKKISPNDELLSFQDYREFITAFVELRFKERKAAVLNYDINQSFDDKIQIIEENYTGSTRDFLVAFYLMDLVKGNQLEKSKSAFEILKKDGTNKEVLMPVKLAIEKLESVLPGKPAPFFELKDLEGNKVAITDFIGKVIYIDFWASWCVPCLAEVPSAEKLKEYYKEREDLVFLYISFDDKEQDWRDIIKTKDLKGLHILSLGWKSEVADKYNISSIPRYYLIDKNGKIANQNAPRPSDEDVIQEIDRVLNISN